MSDHFDLADSPRHAIAAGLDLLERIALALEALVDGGES